MPLTQLSLVNNSVSPRTSVSFFLQTRCGGIVRQEVLRNNRSTHREATAVSPRAGHVSGIEGMATTPPTTIGDIGSVEQIDVPTDIDVCPAVSEGKDKTYSKSST